MDRNRPKVRPLGMLAATLAMLNFRSGIAQHAGVTRQAGRGWGGAVAQKVWLGNRQTIWKRDLNTGRLKIAGHTRSLV